MTNTIDRPARVGVITDQTGALSFMGIANVNVARMVIDDINSKGGLLGRPVELFIEDSATDDDVAQAAAARLVEADVDVVVGGIYSSTRQAIKVPVVDEAGKLYLYPEQYEGQECHPPHLLHRAGAGSAGRAVLPLADAGDRGHDLLHALGRLHLAPHAEQEGPRGRDRPGRRDRRRGVLPARSRRLQRPWWPTSWRPEPMSCSTRSCRPVSRRSLPSCTRPGSWREVGRWCARTSTRTS